MNENLDAKELLEMLKNIGLPVKINEYGEVEFNVTGWKITITEEV